VQGGAVTTFLPFDEDGRPRFCDPTEPPELLLLEPPELLLEPDDMVHGGTMIVVTPLFDGSTSWFWGVDPPLELPEPDELAWAFTPPGVRRMVLDGGGWLPLDEELELELDEDWPPCWHGCTATVCVRVPIGTRIWFDPGGIFELPDCATGASEHGGTAMVRSPCCFGITTVRTPGF
jgi:hypothetical protein